MATRRLERNIKDDYLTCSICFNPFKDPRKLPCDHSFCLVCLQQYVKPHATTVVCPICRSETKRPVDDTDTWIENLPKDSLLEAIILTVNEHSIKFEEEKSNCDKKLTFEELCEEHKETATLFCTDHEVFVCENCLKQLHRKCVCVSTASIECDIATRVQDLESKIYIQLNSVTNQERLHLSSIDFFQASKNEAVKKLKSLKSGLDKFFADLTSSIETEKAKLDVPEQILKSSIEKLRLDREYLEQSRHLIYLISREQILKTKLKLLKELSGVIMRTSLFKSGEEGQIFIGNYQIEVKENKDLNAMMKLVKFAAKLNIICEEDLNSETEPKKVTYESDLGETGETVAKELSTSSDTVLTKNQPRRNLDSVVDQDFSFQLYQRREFQLYEDQNRHCSLSGVCLLKSYLIVIDQHNNLCLKVSFSGQVVDQKHIEDPYQICVCDNGEVAISCWDKNCIYLLETKESLQVKATIATRKHYLGIHYAGAGRFLVTTQNSCLDIISSTGDILLTLTPKTSWNFFKQILNPLFVPARAILKEDTVFVCDVVKKSLYRIDLQSNILWHINVPGITNMTLGKDVIYCTLSSLNKVMTISYDGQINDKSFLKIPKPWAIDVDDDEQCFVITKDGPSGLLYFIYLEDKSNI